MDSFEEIVGRVNERKDEIAKGLAARGESVGGNGGG